MFPSLERRTGAARLLTAALVALAVAAVPAGSARAQDRVFQATEVSTPPKVKSPQAAARAIERAYPAALQSVGGRVQLQFVVRPDGKVDPASIEVLVASTGRLGDAAKEAVERIEFVPGMIDGKAVATTVRFPVTFAAK